MELAIAIVTILGSYLLTVYTNSTNRKKMTAEVDEIYERLGLDKDKAKADNANTWMDVARKAAEEYERVMKENVSLKKQVVKLQRQVTLMKGRITSLESKKSKKQNRNV